MPSGSTGLKRARPSTGFGGGFVVLPCPVEEGFGFQSFPLAHADISEISFFTCGDGDSLLFAGCPSHRFLIIISSQKEGKGRNVKLMTMNEER